VSASISCGLGRGDVATYSCCLVELALIILKEDLHVQDEYHGGSLASAPTTNFELDAIGRECARRAFWYIRLMHLTAFTYFQIPAPPMLVDSNLRLPVDEASFEFGAHNSQSGSFNLHACSPWLRLIFGRLPLEYLHLPAPRTQYVSEYGHLLRIASVYGRLEGAINAAGSVSIFSHVCPVLILVCIVTVRPTAHDTSNVVIEEAEQELSVRLPYWKPNCGQN